jgi:hypothetical protein
MDCYLILTATGFFTQPVKFNSIFFPKSLVCDREHGTKYPFKSAALHIAKKYKLKNYEIVTEDY